MRELSSNTSYNTSAVLAFFGIKLSYEFHTEPYFRGKIRAKCL